jgi:uncharacterized protein with NAD-binding domain and iron-sulfur cluster
MAVLRAKVYFDHGRAAWYLSAVLALLWSAGEHGAAEAFTVPHYGVASGQEISAWEGLGGISSSGSRSLGLILYSSDSSRVQRHQTALSAKRKKKKSSGDKGDENSKKTNEEDQLGEQQSPGPDPPAKANDENTSGEKVNNDEDNAEEPATDRETEKITSEEPTRKEEDSTAAASSTDSSKKKKVVIIGAGWGGLSTAHALSKDNNADIDITVIDASPRVGGLVRDGFTTTSGKRPAEAGQHGFWNNYHNIFRLLKEEIPGLSIDQALTDYAEQGQYSPNGQEAVWPVYRDQPLQLPTGLAQAAFTRFLNLPLLDRITAFPLVLAFSEFDDSVDAWEKYDQMSFRDLCIRLGVSKRCYDEAFEPMILTGLFAPGAQCSAAAALGMAYFFVLQSQQAFDVQWCRGNIGETIFQPWVETMKEAGVKFQLDTQITGFQFDNDNRHITQIQTKDNGMIEADEIVLAVGAKALANFVTFCPELAQFPELAKMANLRGTGVLATRIFLDKDVKIPYSANACWGFDQGVGMTMFDIKALHGEEASTVQDAPGSVIEVDYYHANKLLVLSDDDIVAKVKRDLDQILTTANAEVVDAAIVRLPQAVNWYYPGSYEDMPNCKSTCLENLYFAGDIVRSRHGSWSQEKAYVTGIEAANTILGKGTSEGILPLAKDELHVQLGRKLVRMAKTVVGKGGDPWKAPSLADFFF